MAAIDVVVIKKHQKQSIYVKIMNTIYRVHATALFDKQRIYRVKKNPEVIQCTTLYILQYTPGYNSIILVIFLFVVSSMLSFFPVKSKLFFFV